MKDLFGKAILDFQTNNAPEDLTTETTISDEDEMSVAYLFRSYKEMPVLEQKALQLAKGKVLDVGCGAGAHSLYLQNEKNLEVHSIDISYSAVATCKLRGLKNVHLQNILEIDSTTSANKYDTIFLLMNGTGIFQSLELIDQYLQKLKSLVAENGQILIDSTDILYMYDQDEEGGVLVPATGYYGELDYYLHYKGESELPMKWLYLDFDTLENAAIANGFKIQKIEQLEDSYLAQLTLK